MMEHRIQEAIRYLGYGKNAVDEKTFAYIEESFALLEECERKKFVYRIFACNSINAEETKIGELHLKSKNLAKNVKGCNQAVVIAATLGPEVDRMLKRLSVSDMAKAVVFQAACAAYLEEYLDECQEELKRDLSEECYFRPRFSPGYGDLALEVQEEILQMLDTAKTIGLSRTEGNMLVPTKSVTAFIAMSKEKTDCHRGGCENCGKTDCVYRRC